MPENKSSPPVMLTVFPNTGHHFFLVRLADLLPGKPADFFVKHVENNRGPFRPWDEFHPWLRYKYDRTEDDRKEPIIRIAVETNLGQDTRGTLYRVLEEPSPPDLSQIKSPYVAKDEGQLEDDWSRMGEGQEEGGEESKRVVTIDSLPSTATGASIPINLEIWFRKSDRPAGPLDVDLIVDLGNTRTAALLLESSGGDLHRELKDRLFQVRLMPRGQEYEQAGQQECLSSVDRGGGSQDECAVFDSWLLLHRTLFAHLEPPATDRHVFKRCQQFPSQHGDKGLRYRIEWYLPHLFVELSPALIGGGRSFYGAAETFSRVPLEQAYRFYLSSPKRYAWSTEREGLQEDDRRSGIGGGSVWYQVPNPDDPLQPGFFRELKGLFRYFMSPDRKDLDIHDRPRPEDFHPIQVDLDPTFSYSDAICWFALSIIEAAYRQMNSVAYLNRTMRNTFPRRLRHVRVTCPAGWTFEERDLYFYQWQRAINLFAMTHFEDWRPIEPGDKGGNRPLLKTESLDEAVCSQLPILYADINALSARADEWIELYGSNGSVVVMNLDIGGGTTDLAIIQYRNQDRHGVSLKPELLFRDGYSTAGDMLVKAIIERVLVPAWLKTSDEGQYQDIPGAKKCLETLFQQPKFDAVANADPFAPLRLMRIIRLLFIPLANLLLQRLGSLEVPLAGAQFQRQSSFTQGLDVRWEDLDIEKCLRDHIINKQALADLNDLCAKVIRYRSGGADWVGPAFADNVLVRYSPVEVEKCIDQVFAEFFNGLGRLVGQFSCHLLIVSGKPSELPRLRELLVQSFPLLPHRIIQVKNYLAGKWYPFRNEDGKIKDAKTCTVVGAALYQDYANGDLQNFALDTRTDQGFLRNAYWGFIPEGGSPDAFFGSPHLLFGPSDYPSHPTDPNRPDEIVREKVFSGVRLTKSRWIGRQVLNLPGVRPAPVYRMRWQPKDPSAPGHTFVSLKLRWRSIRGKGDMLDLVGITPEPDQFRVGPQEVRWQLCTIKEEGSKFWLDDPTLDVRLVETKEPQTAG